MVTFNTVGVDGIVFPDEGGEARLYSKGTAPHKSWLNYLGPDENSRFGIWQSDAGSWDITFDKDEYCLFTHGEAVLTDTDGNSRTVVAGDSVMFPAGYSANWDVQGTIKKIFLSYTYTGQTFPKKGVNDLIFDATASGVVDNFLKDGVVPHMTDTMYTSPDGNYLFGVWTSEAGSWDVSFTRDELCYFTEGTVTLTDANGGSKTFNAGDVALFPAGFTGTWHVDKFIKKTFASYAY